MQIFCVMMGQVRIKFECDLVIINVVKSVCSARDFVEEFWDIGS